MKQSKLEQAIRAGDVAKARQLIAAGHDVRETVADGKTLVQLAAREHQPIIVRALVAAGADLEELADLNVAERMALFFDASFDHEEDDDLIESEELREWAIQSMSGFVDDGFRSAVLGMEGSLLRAARLSNLEMLQEGLEAGEDVNQMSQITRDTPLSAAVEKGDVEMAEILIKAGADVNLGGFGGPLAHAVPDLRMMKLLVDAGALADQRDGPIFPLERALASGERPDSSESSPLALRFFLEAGIDPPGAERIEGEILMELEFSEAWELYHELLPHYPFETARMAYGEVSNNECRKTLDDGFYAWNGDLDYAAGHGKLDEIRELLAKTWERDTSEALGNALRTAMHAMELDAARLLIEAGADLNASKDNYKKEKGSSPLAAAAVSWHRRSKEAMRLLLDAGADINHRAVDGRTALTFAVIASQRHSAPLRKAIPLLLEAGADPNVEDDFGLNAWTYARTPIIEAEERQRLGTALPDAVLPDAPIFACPDLAEFFSDSANAKDVRQAPETRCRKVLKLLEDAGARPQPERENDLRLMVAAVAGDAERVAELLAAGANPRFRDPNGKYQDYALVKAAAAGSLEAVRLLIEAKNDNPMQDTGRFWAFEEALGNLDRDMARLILDAGVNLTSLMARHDNPLDAVREAGAEDLYEMVREAMGPTLIEMEQKIHDNVKAEEDLYNAQDELARHAANGDVEKVREILAMEPLEDYGVKIDVDATDPLDRTALQAAAEAGHLDVLELLLEAGADVNKVTGLSGSPRSTALTCAAICPAANRDAVIRRLIEAGADLNLVGADGRTALHHAVERDVGFFGRVGDFALSTRTLVEAGADLEIRDRYNLTPWMRARSLASFILLPEVRESYEKVAGLLADAGASQDGLRDVELLEGVMDGEEDRVRQLLEDGANPSARRFDGATALMLAMRDDKREIAQMLIDAGCDVGVRQWDDERGPTALDAAEGSTDRRLARMVRQAGTRQAAAQPTA